MSKHAGLTNGGIHCGCLFEKKTPTRKYERWARACPEHAEAFAKEIQRRKQCGED